MRRDRPSDRHDEILSICLPATLQSVDEICEKVRQLWRDAGLSQSAFAIQILLRETLNNAVIHGTGENPDKRVTCTIRKCGNDCMELSVIDEGHGFDWKRHWNHISDTDCSSGRGVAIMRRYGKEVRFNKKGNGVSIVIDTVRGGAYGENCGRQ